MCCGRWPNNGYITEAQRAVAAATPLGTIRYGSSAKFRDQGGYFMEEVRRDLMKRFGETADDGPNSVYAGGLWVRTSMVPKMQDAAAEALREGLAKFDGGRGWRDTGLSIDVSGDWQTQLRVAALGTGFPDWRKAVVLDKSGSSARIGFPDGSTGTLPESAAVQPVRGVGGTAFDALRPGMIIIVKQLGLNSYALRSIPEVGGGFVAEEVHTGRVLAMQGGFDVIGSSYNRATQAQRQPGSAFKPIVYVTALENGMSPASIIVDAPFCVWQGAGLGNKCFRNFDGKYSGAKTMRWGVEQSRNLMTIRAAAQTGMEKVVANASKLGVGNYDRYLSIALGRRRHHGAQADQRLCDPGQQWPVGDSDADRLCPGPQRQGHLPHRQPLPGDGSGQWRRLQRARLGRQGDAAAAVAAEAGARRPGGLSDGPHPGRRGRARHRDRAARPRPAAVRQDRHHLRPDQRLVHRRHARGRRRRLYRLRPAAADGPWRAGRPGRGADLQAIRPGRVQGHAQDAVRGAAGIRMVRIDRVTGKRVFGSFPTDGRSQIVGDLGGVPARNRAAPRLPPERRAGPGAATMPQPGPPPQAGRAAQRPAQQRAPADSAEFLQRQGGIY